MDPKAGLLASENPSKEEMDVFLSILRSTRDTNLFDFLNYVMAEETLLFLDVFASETLKIPPREEVAKDLDHARIYLYVKAHQEEQNVIKNAARKFQRRSQSITRIVDRVESVLKKGGEKDGDPNRSGTGHAKTGGR